MLVLHLYKNNTVLVIMNTTVPNKIDRPTFAEIKQAFAFSYLNR